MNSKNDSKILLEAIKSSKSFGTFQANKNVNFSIKEGEIHALLGENGAGKSTFVKIIYGLLTPDEGKIFWKGNEVVIQGPKHARAMGIGMVFQHFSLFEALTVLENISLALPGDRKLNELNQEIKELSIEYGLEIDPSARIYNLSVGEQQRVEIIRCLLQNPDLLIMDEPTSVLTPQEINQLFDVLRKLSEKGCAILFITHKLEEVRSLTSKATVLRRGENVGTVDTMKHTAKSFAKMMVGHEVKEINTKKKVKNIHKIFSLNSLNRKPQTQFSTELKNIQLDAYGGEILGIAGIAGNGQKELMESLIGEYRSKSPKEILFNEQDISLLGPDQRRNLGMAFIPEERIGRAAIPNIKLSENFLLTDHVDKNSIQFGIINYKYALEKSSKIVNEFDVRIPKPNPFANALSGGNLQKFIVGREISRDPKLLIANQPTWGVDIGAALAIRKAIINVAEKGSAVILISQDLEEIFLISDKIAVINSGQISKPFYKDDISIEDVGLLMGGVNLEAKT
tara:strand:+ start:323 stop:1855 length:1533 start_codon:yes stop_codon:yes gene_type:complete